MLVRARSEVKPVEWGNGLSRRFLVEADGLGYTVTETTVSAGTRSLLHYPNHLEACYCIGGRGAVIDSAGRSYRIEPGTLYALDDHDPHCLVADPGEDLRLVCVFAPALTGDEIHVLDPERYSAYSGR
jgi:L-ectoine synthase